MGAGTRGGNPRAKRVQRPRKFQKRKFVKKKPLFKPRKPVSLGTEVYQLWVEGVNRNLVYNAGSATNGPKSSQLILPAGFDSTSKCQDGNGTLTVPKGAFIKPVYSWTTKLRISFNHISKHLTTGAICRVHHGVMKIAPDKFNADTASQATFEAAVLVQLKKELFESEISADYLAYAKKNRNIKVNGSFVVRPSRDHMIRDDHSLATANEQLSQSFPPPRCYTINHPVPKMKTRVVVESQTPAALLHNLWVPWTMISCERLNSDSGYFLIENSSKMYFTDF